jgi:hypothetical protein
MEIRPDFNALWLLGCISTATIALPVMAGIIRYGRLSAPLKILSWLLFYSGANAALTSWLAIKGINNQLFINIFTLVELTLFGWVFHKVFESRGMKTLITFGVLACVAFTVINLFFLQGFSMALESMLLTVLALLFYYKTFREERVQRLERYPLFWLSSGVLLFFAGNLFVFLFSSYVLTDSPNALVAEWSIHSVLYITTNLIYTAAFWLSPQK